jgi:hypothetical protein
VGQTTQNDAQYMGFEQSIVAIVMVLYAIVGVSYAIKGDFPWALVWLSYAMANVGLMWAASAKY